ncbi:DUF1614 domain-containing protein [Desulfofundulus sp. TPOSR]|jgi:uncharacterized membrane protein|uniref:DUF1614 domain-containing protein n=1 Tax=Desulfofundulus sp. TPOSR TaxID=2714340 RepID=UPI001A9B2A53|nr:DUF1614 domain-containing protein [Desulfofundulus sp. TPOSR]
MVPLIWLIFLILLFPFLIFVLFFQVATFSFAKLGLSPQGAVLLFSLSIIGGIINIPISRRRFVIEEERFFFPFLFYYPPRVREQIIAVNVGGAVIPVLFSLYLLERTPLWPALTAVAIVTIVAKALARPVPGVGISLPAFIPPLVAAAAAILLAGKDAAPVAYIAGVWGTLIGADLLNLYRLRELGAHVLSIGGAGVFDGIFLVGVVAALLA